MDVPLSLLLVYFTGDIGWREFLKSSVRRNDLGAVHDAGGSLKDGREICGAASDAT
jgi:hypothetical protein